MLTGLLGVLLCLLPKGAQGGRLLARHGVDSFCHRVSAGPVCGPGGGHKGLERPDGSDEAKGLKAAAAQIGFWQEAKLTAITLCNFLSQRNHTDSYNTLWSRSVAVRIDVPVCCSSSTVANSSSLMDDVRYLSRLAVSLRSASSNICSQVS